ncbi:MAG: hypothetical protein JWN02_1139 [Acidobacteria bacterium]|nr:hypothetical protein [Acidobacteriota bacterium]
MTTDALRVLEDGLKLDVEERAKVAAELLASLDPVEDDVEAAWAAEIAKRVADARANPDDSEDWRVALAAIEREVLGR